MPDIVKTAQDICHLEGFKWDRLDDEQRRVYLRRSRFIIEHAHKPAGVRDAPPPRTARARRNAGLPPLEITPKSKKGGKRSVE